MKVYNKAKHFFMPGGKKRLILVCTVLAALLSGADCWANTPQGICFRYFAVVFPFGASGEVLYDSHGGFLGDGIRLTRFSLGEKAAPLSGKARQAGWQALPFPDWLTQHYSAANGTPPEAGVWQYRGTGGHLRPDGKPGNYVLAVLDTQGEALYILEYDS